MPASFNYLGGETLTKIQSRHYDNYLGKANKKAGTDSVSNVQDGTKVQKSESASKAQKFQDLIKKNQINDKGDRLAKTDINNAGQKIDIKLEKEREKGRSNLSKAAQGQARAAQDGTDFALKDVAKQIESQILGIMWNIVFSQMERDFQGGIGEEIFFQELVTEMVKVANDGDMGEIAQSIYDEVKRQIEPAEVSLKI